MGILSPPQHTTEFSPSPTTKFHSPLLKREMPGLDTLRGVAVLSVVFYHGLHWWLPPSLSISPGAKAPCPCLLPPAGWVSTSSSCSPDSSSQESCSIPASRPNYWKSFYTRRALRILPLYLVIFLILRFYSGVSWMYFVLCLFYMANFATAAIWPRLWSALVSRGGGAVLPGVAVSGALPASSLAGHGLPGKPLSLALCCDISPSAEFSPWETLIRQHGWSPTISPPGPSLPSSCELLSLLSPECAAAPLARVCLARLLLVLGFYLQLMSKSTAAGAAFQPEPFILLFSALLLLAFQFGSHPRVFRLTRAAALLWIHQLWPLSLSCPWIQGLPGPFLGPEPSPA